MPDPVPSGDLAALHEEIRRLRPLADLGRMAATVAHEVRNPLAGISANAEVVREVLSDPADIECVDIILHEVERLGRLVTDLLYYSREREPVIQPLDLYLLASTSCDLSADTAHRQGVQLARSGTGFALGDIELSRQALLNVIRNGIEACRPGGQVTVTVEAGGISVRDQGGGVPEKLRATLFEPFVSGRTKGGLGLGASVAKRCMQRQGGDIVLVETGEQGSLFRFTWPAKPPLGG